MAERRRAQQLVGDIVFHSIESQYNAHRRHSEQGILSPAKFGRRWHPFKSAVGQVKP